MTMNKTIKKVFTGVAGAALLGLSMTPAAFADTDALLHGNGAFSESDVDVVNHDSTEVDQSNFTDFRNHVATFATTGGNDASFNTGGSVTIYTGDAAANTTVSNSAGSNVASVGNGCGCEGSDTDVVVHGNGAFSENDVDVRNWNREEYRQHNETVFLNSVLNKLSTGNNSANFNTGTDVVIVTGDASSRTLLHNQAGSNVLR